LRSRDMVGRAVETIVASRAETKRESWVVVSVLHVRVL